MNILLFGYTGSIGSYLFERLKENGNRVLTAHYKEADHLYDFQEPDKLDDLNVECSLDAIIFAQGLNPSVGFDDLTKEHFQELFNINIIGPSLILRHLKNRIKPSGVVIFFSSVATRKGSYDLAYGTAKSSIQGLVNSISNYMNTTRFVSVSLGLIENSQVERNMTSEFKLRHSSRMLNNKLITKSDVYELVNTIIQTKGITRTEIRLDGGYNV